MTARSVPLAMLLSVVPYFHSRGPVPVTEAARDLGMTEKQLRSALWQLWSCGLPGYGPGDLIDLGFSTEDLDEARIRDKLARGLDAVRAAEDAAGAASAPPPPATPSAGQDDG